MSAALLPPPSDGTSPEPRKKKSFFRVTWTSEILETEGRRGHKNGANKGSKPKARSANMTAGTHSMSWQQGDVVPKCNAMLLGRMQNLDLANHQATSALGEACRRIIK